MGTSYSFAVDHERFGVRKVDVARVGLLEPVEIFLGLDELDEGLVYRVDGDDDGGFSGQVDINRNAFHRSLPPKMLKFDRHTLKH